MPPTALARLYADAGAADTGEAAVEDLPPPLYVAWLGGRPVAVAGYRQWPAGLAHLSVLVHPQHRRQGHGHRVAAAATASALRKGLLAQWRARPEASRALSRSLGYTELGEQLSVHLPAGGAGRRRSA